MVALISEYGKIIIEIIVFAMAMVLFTLSINGIRKYQKSFIAIVTGVPRDQIESVYGEGDD